MCISCCLATPEWHSVLMWLNIEHVFKDIKLSLKDYFAFESNTMRRAFDNHLENMSEFSYWFSRLYCLLYGSERCSILWLMVRFDAGRKYHVFIKQLPPHINHWQSGFFDSFSVRSFHIRVFIAFLSIEYWVYSAVQLSHLRSWINWLVSTVRLQVTIWPTMFVLIWA